MQTIGILLPRSSFYTGIGFDLFEGLKCWIKFSGLEHEVRIASQNIGFGAEKQQVYRAAEQLLLQENAQVVFAYISSQSAQVLRPLFMAANKLLVVLDAGVNLPQEWPSSPNVFYHSLHNSLGASFISQLADRDGFKNAGVVSCFYDGGYLHTYAMAHTWLKADKNIVYNHVAGYKSEEFTMEPLLQYSQQNSTACLFAIFSADFAQWFYRDMKKYFSGKPITLYVPPFALEESMLSSVEYPGFAVKGVASWAKSLDNEQNLLFINEITEAGREANLFSLLGWEAGILGVKILELLKEEKNNGLKAGQKLKTFDFAGPRGKIYFHPSANYTISPLFEAVIEKGESGFCELKIIGKLEGVEEAFNAMSADQLDGAMSGWYNSYTCM